ncbi:hypothetical protein ACLOJK_007643 [Asimina triloba]
MSDVQVWMPAGSGDYVNEGEYTPVFVKWETSIEPRICTDVVVHSKKMKAVKNEGRYYET